ncbi:ABC transporter permease [Leucobacter soli]|uniref:ABC-type transport system involved in multi-copper enzyme maturation, permease component n=1 Tax=Leucobacter soli TaxID=2812850 RepID=A0A916NF59_9MICO|nr:ABC transporter permease [Leucobacter soli]CAG7600242.1 hypothetical protein LEUCIP111803_00369 [Leucobacter soli]
MTETISSFDAPAAVRAPGFWRGAGSIAALELRQRLRSRTLWVLAIVWFAIIGAVTVAMWATLSLSSTIYDEEFDAYPLFSIIVYFVLLFGTLVAPAISAGSISSERTGGTLATTQVTLVGTSSILFGKALAAWATGLAFLVVASPFVILSLVLARTGPLQLLTAVLALALQIGLFTAFGVGLSAMISSPLFAIVTAYLLVALLSIGTLIAFGLSLGVATRYTEVEYRTFSQEYWDAYWACDPDGEGAGVEVLACQEAVPVECVTETMVASSTPTDRFWWILAMNPYVIVADMVSVRVDDERGPEDLFSMVSYGVRTLQTADVDTYEYDDCPTRPPYVSNDSGQDPLAGTIPVWWIGLGLQVLIAGGLLWGGYRRLDTPAAKLPKGSRVA